MKIILTLLILFIATPCYAITTVYPEDKLSNNSDVSSSVDSAITDDVLKYNGTVWTNATMSLEELNDTVITSPSADDSLLYNGTAWVNVPHTYGEMYYHNDVGTLDFATDLALINVTGISNGMSSNMTLNSTNGSITVIDADTYRASLSASNRSASSATYNYHIGVNGAEEDRCHANRRIDTAVSVGNIGITCLIALAVDDVVTFMINSVASETIEFEAFNFNLERIP